MCLPCDLHGRVLALSAGSSCLSCARPNGQHAETAATAMTPHFQSRSPTSAPLARTPLLGQVPAPPLLAASRREVPLPLSEGRLLEMITVQNSERLTWKSSVNVEQHHASFIAVQCQTPETDRTFPTNPEETLQCNALCRESMSPDAWSLSQNLLGAFVGIVLLVGGSSAVPGQDLLFRFMISWVVPGDSGGPGTSKTHEIWARLPVALERAGPKPAEQVFVECRVTREGEALAGTELTLSRLDYIKQLKQPRKPFGATSFGMLHQLTSDELANMIVSTPATCGLTGDVDTVAIERVDYEFMTQDCTGLLPDSLSLMASL